jgi:hypothetical protein
VLLMTDSDLASAVHYAKSSGLMVFLSLDAIFVVLEYCFCYVMIRIVCWFYNFQTGLTVPGLKKVR